MERLLKRMIASYFVVFVFGIVHGRCLDGQGYEVKFGKMYFDGTRLAVCKKTERHAMMDFMEEKWTFAFEAFDFDGDGVITRQDFDIPERNFIRIFNLQNSDEAKIVSKLLDNFLHCILLDELNSIKSLTKDRLISIYKKAFRTNRLAMVKHSSICNAYLTSAIDRNGDGFLSLTDLSKHYEAWQVTDSELVKTLFELMGPNDDYLLPVENYIQFYDEFLMGVDKQKFHAFKKAYADAGFIQK